VGAEVQQHGLLDPLVGHPFAVDLLGDAQLALVEVVDDVLDGAQLLGRRGGGRQLGAALPEVFDDRRQRGV
jgi:hypothetical protein